MNTILCGLPMCGKTTIGQMVAKKLNMRFIDTDRLLESAYAKLTGHPSTCRQIYLVEGETYFRQLEKKQLETLLNEKHAVIALGGGAFDHPDHPKIVREAGRIIFLKASPEILWKRVSERGIPAFLDPQNPEKSFHALADKRQQCYEKACHAWIETDHLAAAEVVDAIIDLRGVYNGQ